jgi:hypothetical protein
MRFTSLTSPTSRRRPRAWLIAGSAVAVAAFSGLAPVLLAPLGSVASAQVASVSQALPAAGQSQNLAYQSPGTPSPSVAGGDDAVHDLPGA